MTLTGIKAETVVGGFSVLECRSSRFRTLYYLAVESQHVLECDRTVFSMLYARHRALQMVHLRQGSQLSRSAYGLPSSPYL
jgi:hypothetical protein